MRIILSLLGLSVLLLFIAVLVLPGLSLSQTPVLEWSKTYGISTQEVVSGSHVVIQTNDGGYALVAIWAYESGNSDFWLVKTDENGTTQWDRRYGGTGNEEAWAAIQIPDGSYLLAGMSDSFSGNSDFWLVKTDANGNMVWNHIFGGAGEDCALSLIRTSDGGYALAGYTDSFSGSRDGWLIKTDANGNEQWSQVFGGTDEDRLLCLIQTMDGGYALTGLTYSFAVGGDDVWLVKTDVNGNLQWQKSYGGANDDYAFCLVQRSDGGFAIAGVKDYFGPSEGDFWLISTDADGNLLWDKSYGGSGHETARCLLLATDGGYVLAGYTYSFGYGIPGDNADAWLVKTDSSGTVEWDMTFGTSKQDVGLSLIRTSGGGYAFLGYSNSYNDNGSYDAWLIKLTPPIPPVGGEWVPTDMMRLLAPWIASVSLMMMFAASFVYIKHKRKQAN